MALTIVSQRCCFVVVAATLMLGSSAAAAAATVVDLATNVNNKALVDYICKQAESYDFCFSILSRDVRTPSADIHGLSLLSIALSIDQVSDTIDQKIDHPTFSHAAADHVDKDRMDACKSDYEKALTMFLRAYDACSRRSYWEVIDLVKYGANKAIDCENIYRRHDPMRVSPISGDNHKLIRLAEITLIVIDTLLRSTP
ncbi:Pectinesterase inhibitor domain containing protein [Parasponia andersonii]|uniref:Pectinesterase inhibitor domain containing protein n=1 Tax=Parasponia andersonii TaxID=3476 RepID=A0A2P5CL48_PARAD|nr:Pectinesterase inhibitor domain containing protein [Parasponia andersonii]